MKFLGWLSARSRMLALELGETSATPPAVRSNTDVPGPYASLHTYLEKRYASLVVLTFDQIESLLGFKLPDAARTDGTWWTHPGGHTAAWMKARRTATPNLLARNVAFERLP